MSSINGCKCSWRDFCWNCLCDDCDGENQKSAYGYVYLVKEGAEINILFGGAIPFNRNGILKGITHELDNNNRDTIIIQESGIYEVSYYFDNNSTETLELALNGVPVAGSKSGAGTGSSIEYGQVIIKVEKNNSNLKLINKGGSGSDNKEIKIAKLNHSDEPDVVISSIYIEKIDDI